MIIRSGLACLLAPALWLLPAMSWLPLSADSLQRGTIARYAQIAAETGFDLSGTGAVSERPAEPVISLAEVEAKYLGDRSGPSALDIAAAFSGTSSAYAELRVALASRSFAKVHRLDDLTPEPQPEPAAPISEDDVRIASLGPVGGPGRPEPEVAASDSALDAVNAVALPEGLVAPVPVAVPEHLAYARETAPATDTTKPKLREAMKVSNKERWCMAQAIYFEARGESYRGQVAVAQVVRNRVDHKQYPNTICGVVFQNQHRRNACQFSFACDGIPETIREQNPWREAQDIADAVIGGELYLPEVSNATHYHATYVRPYWARRMDNVAHIGLHKFYRFRKS